MATKIKLGNGQWGVKENGLLAYNDEDAIFKAIEMDFSRSSTATKETSAGTIGDSPLNTPRIDFTDNSNGALLLEPQRRNLLPYSADFTQTDWTSGSTATLNANYGVAPDGTTSSVLVTNSGGGGSQQLAEVVPVTSGETYTVSFWVKRVTGSGTISIVAIENTATTIAVTSEWQRFSVTATATSTNGRAYLRVDTAGDEVEVWGAQLEDNGVLGGGDYMTSYIPTSGATATRVAETCSKSGLGSYINSSEGVLYAEMSALDSLQGTSVLSINDGTTSNRVSIYYSSAANNIQGDVVLSGVVEASFNYTLTDSETLHKVAFSYKENDFKCYINGLLIRNDTSGSTFSSGTLTKLAFDAGNGTLHWYGKVKDLRVYDTALTDAELTTLTTL